jgi:hypothetical protein
MPGRFATPFAWRAVERKAIGGRSDGVGGFERAGAGSKEVRPVGIWRWLADRQLAERHMGL